MTYAPTQQNKTKIKNNILLFFNPVTSNIVNNVSKIKIKKRKKFLFFSKIFSASIFKFSLMHIKNSDYMVKMKKHSKGFLGILNLQLQVLQGNDYLK